MSRRAGRGTAILLPGFGGTARSPVLLALARRLRAIDVGSRRFAPAAGRPSPGLRREVEAVAALRRRLPGPHVLIGRSFGGRVCARLAQRDPPTALILLAFPVRPPGRRRPDDERALASARCPVLVVQGDRDELGPLRVVRALARRNRRVELAVLKGAGHSWGSQEAVALDGVVDWLDRRLAAPRGRRG